MLTRTGSPGAIPRPIRPLELRIVSRSGRVLIEEIENGLLDAGITAMQVTEPGILVEPLWNDQWIVVLPSAHVLAPARAIELAELAREPIALPM